MFVITNNYLLNKASQIISLIWKVTNKFGVCLTLYLRVSSADNVCKQFDPDQARQNVRPDLDPSCLTLLWYL